MHHRMLQPPDALVPFMRVLVLASFHAYDGGRMNVDVRRDLRQRRHGFHGVGAGACIHLSVSCSPTEADGVRRVTTAMGDDK